MWFVWQSDVITKKDDAITVEGQEVHGTADYQGPSFPPKPAHYIEPSAISASDLDKKLRENLEQKTMEWYRVMLRAKVDYIIYFLGFNRNY